MALGELAGVHVLVVEDTDDSREMLRIALEYCGALVTTAASAEEAKRILEHVRPHVLVSDIAMPDDGIELIREVMTVAQRKGLRIPAIAVTAHRGQPEGTRGRGFTPSSWRNRSIRLSCAARSGGTRLRRKRSGP
jgi:CheY-like chemotaxis protein